MPKYTKRFNVTEALALIQEDIDLDDNADIETVELQEISSNIARLDQEFDQQLLEEVAVTLNDHNIEFEISQETQDESEKQKRKRKASPKDWKTNVAKKRRSQGLSYLGKKQLNGKWTTVERPERKIGELCQKETCRKSKSKHCNEFTEDDCRTIFNEFWQTGNKPMQETYIRSLVDVRRTKDPKDPENENSVCQLSRFFHLKKEGTSLAVCKEMFLGVLSILNCRLSTILRGDKENVGISPEVVKKRNPTPSRGSKWDQSDTDFLNEFFEKIPKAPGHYCRKDSEKVYLTTAVKTMTRLHQLYKARCGAVNRNAFALTKFTEHFHENNYSLFKRKKDNCNICTSHEVGNVSKEEFEIHQKLKKDGLKLKEDDKVSADGKSTFVITADTESLLTAPHNDANIMFFHSKLNLHNFTFFDLNSRDVLNFVWTEVNGELEAQNFTSCYIDYLDELLQKNLNTKKVIIWSDGCTYQNRCSILSSALLQFAVKHKVEIFHKYLEKGHTHMECDSVHSNVEKSLKNTTVNLPSDYINVIQSARKNKYGKYRVKYVDFTFFKDYKGTSDIKSIKPSKEKGHPYVVDIRQLRYQVDGTIKFNLTYDDAGWEKLPYKITLTNQVPPSMYTAPLKISLMKYNHLQEIKVTIPKEAHYFYDNLDYHGKE